MKIKTASIVLASALAVAGAASAEDLLTYVRFSTTRDTPLSRGTDQRIEVDIDSAIDVTWRLDQLFAAVAQREGMGPTSALLVRCRRSSSPSGPREWRCSLPA